MGQTTRFSTEFNPAWGFVIDGLADYLDATDDDVDDGFDADIRIFEFNASAFVDPDVWGYFVISSESLEDLELEEAAVEYIGFDSNVTLKAGRFFADFGKQMQQHPEELRTLERPLVLREFLGEELGGVGVQYDNWVALGEEVPVRFSIGVFESLEGGHGHGDEEEDEDEAELHVPDRLDLDEFALTARVTGLCDVGETGVLQLGASLRVTPEFAFETEDDEVDGLSNWVVGADATYGWSDDTGIKSWTGGLEWLYFDGDLAADVDGSGAISVQDEAVHGFYAFADHAWDRFHSAGAQLSFAELPEDPDEDAAELDLYYTWHMTEYRRLRFGVTLAESDFDEADFARGYVQFTNFFGSHAHGINW
jgi:hypothetical protein